MDVSTGTEKSVRPDKCNDDKDATMTTILWVMAVGASGAIAGYFLIRGYRRRGLIERRLFALLSS